MTVQECYEQLGGNYQEAVGRLLKDAMVQRFALKFPKDPSYAELRDALAAGDVQSAFRAAHTLKGVCGNLAFTALYDAAHDITEMLRSGEQQGLEEATAYFPRLEEQYDRTIAALALLE